MDTHTSLFKQGKQGRSRRFKIILAAVVIVVLLLIIIPLAVVLPKRKKSTHPICSILLPLYIYPADGAWDPIFQA